jgi:competence protein ComEC
LHAWLEVFLRSQPLVPAAILFTGGIAVGRLLEFGPGILLGLLVGSVVLSRLHRVAARAVLIFVVGAVIYWCRYTPFSEDDLRVVLPDEAKIVALRGELLETPQVRNFSSSEFTTARLRVSEVRLDDTWRPATGDVISRTRGGLDESYFEGRYVEVAGVIRPPPKALAPGLFDQREYFRNQRIFFQLNADSPADWQRVGEQAMPWMERTRRWAKWQLARGLPEDEQVQMLWAMTLGWKTALSGEMAEPFMRTGTMHIFAISGLHVACIAGMLVAAMQMVGMSRPHCAWVVIPLLWFYTVATGWQSSGVRSALMSTALIAGWSLKRPTALLNSTAAAALLILVFQPEQLFQAGFQLSFAVVISIALIVPFLEERTGSKLPSDPMLPRELRRPWEKILEYCYNRVRPGLIVSAACFIGSLPLVAYYFNLFTPISLIANLLAVPISSLALLFSMLSLVLFPLGEWWNFFSWAFMWETIVLARAFEKVGGYVYVPKPSLAFILFYLVLIIAVFRGWLWTEGPRIYATAVLLVLGVFWGISARAAPSLHILSGAGAPVWVDLSGKGQDLLIDCSNERDFGYTVSRFLRARGVGRIPNLLLTHGDVEHLGGFLTALNEFRPNKVFTGPHSSRSPAHRDALRVLENLRERWSTVEREGTVHGWKVLHPPKENKFSRADDNAVVLKTEVNGWRILHIGDLGPEGQRFLLEPDIDLGADLLIAGSNESIREGFLQRVAPQAVICETGGIKDWNGVVLATEEQGAVCVEFTSRECRITSMNGFEHTLLKEGR